MRKLAWFASGFGAACLLSCYFSTGLLPALLCGAVFVLSLLVWRALRPRATERWDFTLFPRRRRVPFQICRRLMAAALGGTLAFLWFAGYTALFRAPAEELAGTEQTISGYVTTYPEETSIGGYSVIVRLDREFHSPDVLLYGSGDWDELKPGDRVICTARLAASNRMRGDETTYYTARGIFLLGYCNDPPVVGRADSIPLRHWPALCAHALKEGIYAAFDDTAAGLAAAVTLGDKSGLAEPLYSALNRSGIMHAAVVSGLHISFLTSTILLLCRGRRGVALCCFPFLFFYALMAGGTPSAIRAAVMQTILLLGFVLRQDPDVPSSLGFALLVLLIQNPYAAASVSLQLSFAAVAGIALVASPLSVALLTPIRRRVPDGPVWRILMTLCRILITNVAVSLGAMLFTVPLIALYFGRIVLISPLTNILTLWAVTLLMVGALFIGTIAVFLPGWMVIPGAVVGLLAHYIRFVVTTVGRWPLSALDGTDPKVLIWLAAVYLLLLLLPFFRRRRRQAAASLLCAVLLLALVVGTNALSVHRADLTVTALDVGQGASTLFLSGKDAVLVDCGGSTSSSAGDLAADRLAAMGRTGLDALVFTHLDADHVNGAAQLFWRMDVDRVYLPAATDSEHLSLLLDLAESEGARVTFVSEAETLSVGSAALTLYPPLSGGSSNDGGLFALCSHGDFDVLITGDASSFVEERMVKYYPIPDLELLMVGHHGSAYSTSAGMLDVLRPELAVISVGYNSYGHPTQDVLDRLSAIGAEVYRTDLSGPVTIALRNGQVSVR